jgi:hypothetical protein
MTPVDIRRRLLRVLARTAPDLATHVWGTRNPGALPEDVRGAAPS